MGSKYKRKKDILNFMVNSKKPLSRVELIHKFNEGYFPDYYGKPDYCCPKGINTTERALKMLVEDELLKKYKSKTGRIMYIYNGK
jgi:hypothetical protein